MTLVDFYAAIGIAPSGTAKRIQRSPTKLLELYCGVTNDDDRTAQRDKIRNIQLPAIRYFVYYLATSVLGRENTSNISHYHVDTYNLGALIAWRLTARGPIYGGIVVARIIAYLGISVDPNVELLPPL